MSSVTERLSTESVSAVDPYGRPVKSLRLSVTQRCDLACAHCHREGQSPSRVEMSPGEIEALVRIARSVGVRKVKITGGEPLIREDITEVISRISPLVDEVSLTTNGIRLGQLAHEIRSAGLRRVNVSLHTLDPNLYASLCGIDRTRDAVNGIIAAVDAGLNPVKVNMVVLKNENDGEIRSMMEFCGRVGALLQLIEFEADRESENGCHFAQRYYSLIGVEEALARDSSATSYNELHRRRQYRVRSGSGLITVEVVRPMHNTEFCSNCTRIRLSSDGMLKPCLLDHSGEVDILTPLRKGASDADIQQLFLNGIAGRRPYWS